MRPGVPGGKSTTRSHDPRAGGWTTFSRAPKSSSVHISAGVSSEPQIRVETVPSARTWRLGATPSMVTTALPSSSCPVTMRRTAGNSLLLIWSVIYSVIYSAGNSAGNSANGTASSGIPTW